MNIVFTLFVILFLSLEAGAVKTTSLLIFPSQGGIQSRQTLEKAILQAKKSITLACSGLTDPKIINALRDAASQGVKIQILVDQLHKNKDLLNLRHNNIQIRSNKEKDSDFSSINQKVFVFDGRLALVLALDLTKDKLSPGVVKKFPEGYRSFGYVINSPALIQEIQRVFDADWKKEAIVPKGGSIVWGPDNQRTQILKPIRQAKKTIHLYALDLTDQGLCLALEQALRRKVVVRILTIPFNFANNQDLNAAPLQALKRKGAFIKYFPNDSSRRRKRNFYGLEGTFMAIDDGALLITSSPFNSPALDSARQLGVLTKNPTSLSEFNKIWLSDWKRATSKP